MSTMFDNIASSILTENGVEAHEVERKNNVYKGSLAVLYDETWASQNAVSVFDLVDIIRDTREEDRTSEPIPEKACVLGWSVGGEVPLVLHTPFGCRGIFTKGLQTRDLFPPHNPFIELDVRSVEEDLIFGLVVTGTPGIGKTLFLLYVLALRLLARQTTVLQFVKGEFTIFEAAGVFVCKEMEAELLFLPEHTWFLVDSNEGITSPPFEFLRACDTYSRKLIVAASPRQERFEFTSKYDLLWTLWMYPFEFWEYIAARYFQLENTATELQLQHFFRVWGPSARAAFANATSPEEHKREIVQNILNVPWDSLRNVIRSMGGGSFDTKFSHNTLIAKPCSDDPSDFYVEFATKSVAAMVIETFLDVEEQKAQQLYRFFLGSPKARAAAGYLLEVIAMTSFQKGGAWNVQAMEKDKKGGRGQPTKVAWGHNPASVSYTMLIGYGGRPVTIKEGEHLSLGQKKIAEVARVDFNPKDAMTVEGAMYVSKQITNPAFDAWIFNPQDGNMVVIQATCQRSSYNFDSKAFEWFDCPEVKSLDVVIVSDLDGGKKVETLIENDRKIRNVYRLIM
ncbi:uncharacterized protein FOMMEDRAFT_158982 [Fomitiporia mediterranea MF3/22]|uniref:uncharacterized protein n=1 Tax=Fomitiporia mediterranea (strain MF3/22) TaxID=694068 RepID=UPI0004407472|nr:uncharacterized protein FOMMEDRAFT_158982 [Fomitiporia mediterranea MF3/22]EJD00310.1 hypothetical protein FOMMEDRAFT_158982 [Fomitiporia mediterranea MF3/22]